MDAKSRRDTIPFYRPVVGASASRCVADALLGPISGGGRFTDECHRLLRQAIPAGVPFLTSSCTDALELAALALDLKPGDEVVMPSWTFPSTANAFALRGAVPVFVDVTSGTLAIDPHAAAAAITARTRALVCVHYAGVACDMARLVPLCEHHGIALIEDAAQAYHAFWHDAPLGGLGDFGTFSFHGTKNVSCGEGGALIVRDNDLLPRVEIAWEKGTDRLRFQGGQVDTYQWQDLGSSFLPSEVTAAFLSAQLAEAASVTKARRLAWDGYAALMAEGGLPGLIGPVVPAYARHNGHIFAVQLEDQRRRRDVLARLDTHGIDARPHYHPLHASPAGRRLGRTSGPLAVTEAAGGGLIRLPLDSSITRAEQERVINALDDAVRHARTN